MNKQTIILLLVLALLFIPTGVVLNAFTVDRYNVLAGEGCVAYTVAFLTKQESGPATPPTPTPIQTTCSQCKGSKKVKSGDGLVEMSCSCGENCKCEPMQGEPKVKRRVLLVTAPKWCKPCKQIDDNVLPALKAREWKVSDKEDSQVQVIDHDTNPATVEKYNITLLPTFILLEDEKEVNRYSGYLNGWGIKSFWEKKVITTEDVREIVYKAK